MSRTVEHRSHRGRIPFSPSRKPDFSSEPLRLSWTGAVDYAALDAYARAHGAEVAAFVRDHLADDELRPFARALWEYIKTEYRED
jgi:hypothetical protein